MPYEAYARSAQYYDLIYAWKDYTAEAARIAEILQRECPAAHDLLDVACGTGEHARLLSSLPAPGVADGEQAPRFRLQGIDLEPGFISTAREKVPTGRFDVADMADFDLGRRFDAVLCLFSAIGYLLERDRLVAALRCFRRHVRDGGVILVEPWFTPGAWRVGTIHMQTADKDDIKVCRMVVSEREEDVAIMPFHYLVATREGVLSFEEVHRMALRTQEEMLSAFTEAGLEARLDSVGLDGRGIYLARPPARAGSPASSPGTA